MWHLLLLLHVALIEPVTSQGGKKLILRDGDTPCEGHVEVYYNNEWGFVGDKLWSRETEQVVCRSTHCGEPVSSENVSRPKDSKVWLNELKCNGTEKNLWDCVNPGWAVSYYRKLTVKKIKCSSNITLDLDGFDCAGVVRYLKDGKPPGHFCKDGWGPSEYNLLCDSLGCGKAKTGSDSYPGWMVGNAHRNSAKMKINCGGITGLKNAWQCVESESPTSCEPAATVCEAHKRLQTRGSSCSGQLEKEHNNQWVPVSSNTTNLEEACRLMHCGGLNRSSFNETQHLECTDKVEVFLGGTEDRCYGEVHIKVNDTDKPVCGSTWTVNEANVVCRELGCGKVTGFSTKTGNRKSGWMDSVRCSGNEASLWHCQGKHQDSQCQNIASVICSGSVTMRLTDGFSRCSGRLEVKHESEWKKVNSAQWSKERSNIVCKELGCGEALDKSEEFCKGSGKFLDIACAAGVANISECNITNTQRDKDVDPVKITCTKNEVYFLKGNRSCFGEVWKRVNNKDTRVSVPLEKWSKNNADRFCRKVNCGSVLSYTPNVDTVENQNGTDNCSSTGNTTCVNTTAPPTTVDVVVTCSGQIEMNLTDTCRGQVVVLMGTDSGAVCSDTWTDEMSKALCKHKTCGDQVLKPRSQRRAEKILVKSVHTMKDPNDLNWYNYVSNKDDDKSCLEKPAYVVCSGSVKPRFRTSRDKCSGNVEVYYDGEWLPVCMGALNDSDTQNVICRELGCGVAVNRMLPYFGHEPKQDVIQSIKCPSSGATSLSACEITFKRDTCTLGGLQCSEWRTVALEGEGSCRGQVIVHSEGKRSGVSTDGWTKGAGQTLCQDMNCGKYKNFTGRMNKAVTFWNSTFNCTGKKDSIWDCESQNSTSHKENLFIECEDGPTVTLSKKCYGDVTINDKPVCGNLWNTDYSHMVCQEKSCSNAIGFDVENALGTKHHVSCDEHHYILDQCKRVEGECNQRVTNVVCIGAVTFNTSERCGGEIRMHYGRNREKVCYETDLSPQMKENLCRQIGCDGYNGQEQRNNKRNAGPRDTFKWSLSCSQGCNDVKYCIKKASCYAGAFYKIYCNGYVPPVIPDEVTPVSAVTVVIGVGLTLLILIIIVVFVRFYMIKRSRRSRVVSRMLSGKEMEFESGEYEDVMDKSDEMEDFVEDRRERFRSEGESFRGRDRRSISSLNYDDIDVENEGRPLNARDATDAAWEVENVHEDGATYEVDDPQESYDDIEGPPETTETKAEVHDDHKATPEGNAAAAAAAASAAPEPPQGGGDYLVPGQDG
ncbi:scavenger receptor cysteine-rich type 1 protein M130 isoform X2 [Mugil cephalus]|uniref:scavenger receptor cysteine-rich type 1 protein M130 isoform X2 n=1 Tax=Mugil cephalus TaxID=48193 RepID=UPI001FB6D118|nr:scavenger receptor cysteine-rich type 1 protein M130 isoform X2 [Mugil cephalus]